MAPIIRNLVSAASFLACALADDLELTAETLPSDEACDAADPDCGVSFAQLRARQLVHEEHQAEGGEVSDALGSVKEALESRRGSSEDSQDTTSLLDTMQSKHQIMTGYHQTSPGICDKIVAEGFRMGHGGWCGGGIYFAMSPDATYTKAIGTESHLGCMLKVKVDMGKAATRFGKYCDTSMSGHKLAWMGYNSIIFNPGDGREMVVYDPRRILKIEKMWSKADGNAPDDAAQIARSYKAKADLKDTLNHLR